MNKFFARERVNIDREVPVWLSTVLLSGMAFAKENDHTPPRLYALCSLTYLGAMVASNHSLQHVSYPTQVAICLLFVCVALTVSVCVCMCMCIYM